MKVIVAAVHSVCLVCPAFDWNRMPTYSFTPRWREELVCVCAAGQLVFDMPMGRTTVLFPTDEKWNEIVLAPHWAHTRRAEILSELEAWCRSEKIPLVITHETFPTDPTWSPPR
jgi:hypothetical protein